MDTVLVVGAGPVGLTMAAELARRGVKCRIIDRLPEILPYCRAIGVTPRTLEVWDDMGIVQEMITHGLWLTGMRMILNGGPAKDLRRDISDLSYGQLGLPQYETERILTGHLSRFGVEVERPVSLTALHQVEDVVNVNLAHPDGRSEEATFRYVIGCDGAHSSVRKALDIPFDGDAFPMSFMLGDVQIDWDLPRGMAMWSVNAQENAAPDMFIAIPLPEHNRYRVSMVAPNESPDGGTDHGIQTEKAGPPLSSIQEVANRLVPGNPKLLYLRWSSIFRISMRLAQRYREGNVFIAGDAAHIHPPTGGQGMNTGIQDAYNLAWKLAQVIKGSANKSLLDTYEAERRPVGADVVTSTRKRSEGLGRVEGPQDRLVDTQILVNYRGGPLAKESLSEPPPDAAPRAGDRAPDCDGLLMDNVHSPLRLFDILRGVGFVLVLYKPDDVTRLVPIFPEKVVAISDQVVAVPHRITALRDAIGTFAAAYHPAPNTGYLIRPDGYIAYHARPFTVDGMLSYLTDSGLAPEE